MTQNSWLFPAIVQKSLKIHLRKYVPDVSKSAVILLIFARTRY